MENTVIYSSVRVQPVLLMSSFGAYVCFMGGVIGDCSASLMDGIDFLLGRKDALLSWKDPLMGRTLRGRRDLVGRELLLLLLYSVVILAKEGGGEEKGFTLWTPRKPMGQKS